MYQFLKKNWSSILILLIPILFINVIYGIFNYLMILSIILVSLFFFSKDEIALISVLIFPKLFGLLFNCWDIKIPGSILGIIIGLILLKKHKLLRMIKLYSIPFKIIFSIFVLFYVYYLFGYNSINSTAKFENLTINFIVDLIIVLILIKNNNIKTDNISLVYAIYSIFLFSLAYDLLSYTRPMSLMDFESFRNTFYILKSNAENTMAYHAIGNSALTSLAFYFSSPKKHFSFLDLLLTFYNLYIILFSGARQSLVGVFIIFLFLIYLKYKTLNKLLFSVVILYLLLDILLPLLNIQYINVVLYEQHSTSMLNRNFVYPLQVIYDNLFFGVGFGNYYNPFSDETYPHNIILEILCEMGVVAIVIILVLFVIFFRDKKVSLSNKMLDGNYAIMIILPFIIRSIVSDSIDNNFIVFVFILFLLYNPRKCFNI